MLALFVAKMILILE